MSIGRGPPFGIPEGYIYMKMNNKASQNIVARICPFFIKDQMVSGRVRF